MYKPPKVDWDGTWTALRLVSSLIDNQQKDHPYAVLRDGRMYPPAMCGWRVPIDVQMEDVFALSIFFANIDLGNSYSIASASDKVTILDKSPAPRWYIRVYPRSVGGK